MTSQASLRRGGFVLAIFPFTDLTATKLRPALIVWRVTGDDLILAFVTSVVTTPMPSDCALSSTDTEFAESGLKTTSLVRLDKRATLHRSLVRRRLGRTGSRTQRRVDAALRYSLGL